jgi:hypothetical protein
MIIASCPYSSTRYSVLVLGMAVRILCNIRLVQESAVSGLVMLEAGYVPDVLVQVTSHVKRQSSIVKCQASSVKRTPWHGPMSTRVQIPYIRSCFLSLLPC